MTDFSTDFIRARREIAAALAEIERQRNKRADREETQIGREK